MITKSDLDPQVTTNSPGSDAAPLFVNADKLRADSRRTILPPSKVKPEEAGEACFDASGVQHRTDPAIPFELPPERRK